MTKYTLLTVFPAAVHSDVGGADCSMLATGVRGKGRAAPITSHPVCCP